MRLTKTEIKLLKAAVKSRYERCHATLTTGHGADGGAVSEGWRGVNAGNKLAAAGLLVRVADGTSLVTKNGWTQHVTDFVWTITAKGREALAKHEGAVA